jgi:hypothetical protein
MARGFSCSLKVLHGGLERKIAILKKKFSDVKVDNILSSKSWIWIRIDLKCGIRIQCGSTTLMQQIQFMQYTLK